MKKIETGCLAVVIGALYIENNGKVLTVGKYIGNVFGYMYSNHWEVSVSMKNTTGVLAYHMPEHLLLRIDGDDFLEFDNSAEELEFDTMLVKPLDVH